jgi:hypothetical protein
MPDPAMALNAIEAANQARADIWTALHKVEYQLTRNSSSPNLSVVGVALEQAGAACDRTRAAIEMAQAEVGPIDIWKATDCG